MIQVFNTTKDFTDWLDGTLLKSNQIVYVKENENYYFSTNNIDGGFTTVNGTYEDIVSGDYPKSVVQEIEIFHQNLTPVPPIEYVTNEDLIPIEKSVSDIGDAVNDLDDSVLYLKEKIEGLELYKFPNVTIFGEPTIQNGQVSGFRSDSYLQFPFLVDFHNMDFEINMCFTTGENTTTQENIFDSEFGLAFAIRNNHFVIAISTDGKSWEDELIGEMTVQPNTTYYTKLKYTDQTYTFSVSTDKSTYTDDIVFTNKYTPYPKTIKIGASSGNVFGGIINMNYCSLLIRDIEVWTGMDNVGLATRLATNLNNIDEEGIKYITELIHEQINNTFEFDEETGTLNINTIY